MKKVFHILGVAHSLTSHLYPTDAFVLKTLWLSRMLHEMGHTVYVYAVEGSELTECTELVPVVSKDTFDLTYKNRDDGAVNNYDDINSKSWLEFVNKGYFEIKKRIHNHREDFVLVMFGLAVEPLTKRLQQEINLHFVVEPGIGHPGSYAPYRVFESYAWMHYTYGKENVMHPPMYDAVIPHYYYPEFYPFDDKKEDYVLFIGRMLFTKGLTVAIEATRAAGKKLILIGNGNPKDVYDGDMSHVEFLGVKNIYEKVEYIKKAQAFIYASLYPEPFGQAAIEASMCGTPVVATDLGAFTETVKHGYNGYRCRTLDDFVWGLKNIHTIKPSDCRKWAMDNYSADRVKLMFEDYFDRLHTLNHAGYYYINENRTNLDWLKKY